MATFRTDGIVELTREEYDLLHNQIPADLAACRAVLEAGADLASEVYMALISWGDGQEAERVKAWMKEARAALAGGDDD